MRSPDYKHAASGAYRARYEARVSAELRDVHAQRVADARASLAELESRTPRSEAERIVMERTAQNLRAAIARATGGEP